VGGAFGTFCAGGGLGFDDPVPESKGGGGASVDFVVDAEPGSTGGSGFLSEYSRYHVISFHRS
jgi:hypothetical protein